MYIGGVKLSKLVILVVKTSIGYFLFIVIAFTIPIYKNAHKIISSTIDHIYSNRIVIGETALIVKIADTEEARILGLSNTLELKPQNGLFFVFERLDYHGIWMKDMFFPIDIIWIDQNMEVVHIEENVSPDTFPTVFRPSKKSLYVLETNAGFVKKHGIKIGDIITKL
ncbi:MAG TPA: DUF192 domain-containing protein [Candidatus Paceibacterota bacterium]|nr:DUF192 domain-containing protein [Candidatus Paceibacterota bacterium]HMP19253.1 DUF192 domain-containing protein [Candidatus Paceibacterota bacterium]HMP85532.1 DUF192 domain-containing protein [Candidatus Paceibacterota bacterium]